MKKILIFTAGFGEGHNTAARSIRDALHHLAPADAQVEVFDLFESCYGKPYHFVRKAYIAAINRTPRFWGKIYNVIDGTQVVESNMMVLSRMRKAMLDLLGQHEPDVVVSTYPIYNYVLDDLYEEGHPKTFSQITIITDSITVNSVWYRCSSDYFLVANEDTAAVLRAAGCPEDRIKILGFPVPHRFAEMRDRRYTAEDVGPRKVLYMINSGKKEAPQLVERLSQRDDIVLTVTVGRDAVLRREIETLMLHSARQVQILGWTTKMPELLTSHHLIITKAGGATIQEAIAARTPVIISQVVPGQEEGNARLIVENECGMLAPSPDTIVEALETAFANDGEVLRRWVANLGRLSCPDASLQIARYILSLMVSGETMSPRRSSFDTKSVPAKQSILLCDLHTHTTFSDGKLTVTELVDFYGQRGFDALCITDHICDYTKLIGRMTGLTGVVMTLDQVTHYFETIEKEKRRAWEKFNLLLMTGLEFNKEGLTRKSSAHLLGIDLKRPIDPGLSIVQTIAEIHAQGALAIASHPHEFKTTWGKNTLYLWENLEQYAPLLDAWEVASRDDLFNPVGLRRLPFVANSDFHKPKHIFSWKTVLFCEKDPEAIKECIRVNRNVAITLYRNHHTGFTTVPIEQRASRLNFVRKRMAELVSTGHEVG